MNIKEKVKDSNNKIKNLIFSQTDSESLYTEIRHLLAHSFNYRLYQIESDDCSPVDAMNNFWQDITGEDLTNKVDSREIFQQLQNSTFDPPKTVSIHSFSNSNYSSN